MKCSSSEFIDTSVLVTGVQERARQKGLVHVEVIGAITKGEKGKELAEMGDMAEVGAMAFSDDGHYVDNPYIMTLAAKYAGSFGKALICHDILLGSCLYPAAFHQLCNR